MHTYTKLFSGLAVTALPVPIFEAVLLPVLGNWTDHFTIGSSKYSMFAMYVGKGVGGVTVGDGVGAVVFTGGGVPGVTIDVAGVTIVVGAPVVELVMLLPTTVEPCVGASVALGCATDGAEVALLNGASVLFCARTWQERKRKTKKVDFILVDIAIRFTRGEWEKKWTAFSTSERKNKLQPSLH